MAKRKMPEKSKKTSTFKQPKNAHPSATFSPKTWEEIETQGVPNTHRFEEEETSGAKKYPPPKDRKHPTFLARWNEIIEDISTRENFKVSHLPNLVVLCDLYAEYDSLIEILTTQGYTFFNPGGRNGPQLKKRPEAEQLNKTRAEIHRFSKLLGLLLYKDKNLSDEGGESEEWD